MRSFVFNIQLTSPNGLMSQLQIVRDEVFEKEFALLRVLGKREVAIGDAGEE